ncbi:MAG: sce7726 family protein [Cyclobacteriaceae bacterium]|nr:sce7726 family protein [Cyclobacteriaceae bacterium]
MVEITQKIDGLRSLSQLFTPSNFKNVVRLGDMKGTNARIKKHLSISGIVTYQDIFKAINNQLLKTYRSEYFYKNALLNKVVLGKYSVNTTRVLNEFKIGSSCADFVFLNGEVRVYEIKTELDSLSKLHKQIEDYSQIADKVYVVCSKKHAKTLIEKLKNTAIGIIEFTPHNTLKEIKKANISNNLDHTTIFKTLRKSEYIDLLQRELHIIPNVPNTRFFRECLKLAKTIEVKRFQQLAMEQLKRRGLQCPKYLLSPETPAELKYLCYTMDLNYNDYIRLHYILKKDY